MVEVGIVKIRRPTTSDDEQETALVEECSIDAQSFNDVKNDSYITKVEF